MELKNIENTLYGLFTEVVLYKKFEGLIRIENNECHIEGSQKTVQPEFAILLNFKVEIEIKENVT